MIIRSSKTFRGRIFRLLVLLPWLGQAQEQTENDSTFNGVDYYGGRIARGFGGGVAQEVTDEEHGSRFFLTTPSLYGSVGNRLGVRLSNSTRWAQLEEEPNAATLRDELQKYTTQGTSVEAQYRLADGLQLMGAGIYQKDEFAGTITNELKIIDKVLDLRSLYLSHDGRLAPAPEQLTHAYYSAPDHRFLQNQAEQPVKLLSPGQTMLSVLGTYNDSHYDARRTIDSRAEQANLFRSSYLLDADLIHAFNRQVTVGLLLQPARTKTQNSLLQEYPDQTAFASQRTITLTGFSAAPHLDYLSAPQLLHRLHAAYASSRASSSAIVNALTRPDSLEYKRNSWKVSYALHYLGNVASPGVPAFLADANHVFGNRLPARGFHFIGHASYQSFKDEAPLPVPGGGYGPEQKDEQYNFSATGICGLSSGLEMGVKTIFFKDKLTSAYFGDLALNVQRYENNIWYHNLAFSFANYRYEEKHEDRFGWDQIREFDRLYGPLLQAGMMKGELAAQYIDLTNDFVELTGPYSQIHFEFDNWLAEASLRWGLTDELELHLAGQIYDLEDYLSSRSSGKSIDFDIALAWQPWQSARLQIGRSRSRLPLYAFDFLYRDNEVWSLQVMSLF